MQGLPCLVAVVGVAAGRRTGGRRLGERSGVLRSACLPASPDCAAPREPRSRHTGLDRALLDDPVAENAIEPRLDAPSSRQKALRLHAQRAHAWLGDDASAYTIPPPSRDFGAWTGAARTNRGVERARRSSFESRLNVIDSRRISVMEEKSLRFPRGLAASQRLKIHKTRLRTTLASRQVISGK
jgi:hypothetical protein